MYRILKKQNKRKGEKSTNREMVGVHIPTIQKNFLTLKAISMGVSKTDILAPMIEPAIQDLMLNDPIENLIQIIANNCMKAFDKKRTKNIDFFIDELRAELRRTSLETYLIEHITLTVKEQHGKRK